MYGRYFFDIFMAEKMGEDYCLIRENGYILDEKKSKEIALGVLRFFEKYSQQDIDEYNRDLERKKYEEIMSFSKNNKAQKIKKLKMVYLFECNGKYKIGVTSDIKKRLKQLDNRPFPVALIKNSELIYNAFEIEQNLHQKYQKQKIDGEWFKLNTSQVKYIIDYLSKLGGKYGNI